MSGLLEGKTVLVTGVANKWSIAWPIAQASAREGARVAITYQGERFEKNAKELAATLPGCLALPCDMSSDEEIAALVETVKSSFGKLHGLAHCVAFAKREDLQGEFAATSRDGFLLAHNISVYTLVALANGFRPLMEGDGSILTLTYIGSDRAMPNYNVMGVAKASLEASVRYLARDMGPANIRVNAISAGPIKTLAASGIAGFSDFREQMAEKAPLRRNIDQAEVGDTAVYLFSSLSRGVTGEVIHVDAGYHIMGA
ncbi:MAG: enoyl-ACP reductase [Armatimonadetes bacterium]|nr:enoyl-ACP reductase [Armatimonadota bacterium]